jgi:hypothetical protein
MDVDCCAEPVASTVGREENKVRKGLGSQMGLASFNVI